MAKDTNKILKVMQLRASGRSMEEIGAEMGMTRQTVSAYLRTPEAQAIATELQENLLSTLQASLACVNRAIAGGDAKIARDIAVNLGKMVMSQTPMATESRSKLTPDERKAMIARIKDKYSKGESITPETKPIDSTKPEIADSSVTAYIDIPVVLDNNPKTE